MKRLAIVICLGTTSLLAAQRQPPLFAITRVTLIDGTGTAAQADTNVIVSGGRIIAIGPSARTPVPRGAQNIDGRGKFLIPGLWDMHAHPFLAEAVVPANVFLDSYLANGVTTIRDPAGPLGRQVAMRAATARAERAGPRLIVSGPVLDGPAPIWPGVSIAVGAEDAAMTAVATVAGGGADFVKVYDFLPRPAYLAVVAEAKRRKLPFAGHVPIAVTAAEASDAGQVSIEHLIRLFESCSSEELDLQRESLAIVARATSTGTLENTPLVLRDLFHIELRAEKSYDAAKAAALFARLKRNGTAVDPTLVGHGYERGLEPPTDDRLRYVPPRLIATWQPGVYQLTTAYTPDDLAEAKRMFRRRVELVGQMHRAGVTIVAGTDSPTAAYSLAGFGVHDEMALLVDGGLSPMEALQAATWNAAKTAGRFDTLGTIEVGKVADLVLLDANPLVSICNTTAIFAVVANGVIHAKPDLQTLLRRVEARVKGQ